MLTPSNPEVYTNVNTGGENFVTKRTDCDAVRLNLSFSVKSVVKFPACPQPKLQSSLGNEHFEAAKRFASSVMSFAEE